jgi:hypothetical protein
MPKESQFRFLFAGVITAEPFELIPKFLLILKIIKTKSYVLQQTELPNTLWLWSYGHPKFWDFFPKSKKKWLLRPFLTNAEER